MNSYETVTLQMKAAIIWNGGFYLLMTSMHLLARSRRYIWILSDSNVIRTHNHLVRKLNLVQANYKVWIHSETRTWHDNNIQWNAPYS